MLCHIRHRLHFATRFSKSSTRWQQPSGRKFDNSHDSLAHTNRVFLRVLRSPGRNVGSRGTWISRVVCLFPRDARERVATRVSPSAYATRPSVVATIRVLGGSPDVRRVSPGSPRGGGGGGGGGACSTACDTGSSEEDKGRREKRTSCAQFFSATRRISRG